MTNKDKSKAKSTNTSKSKKSSVKNDSVASDNVILNKKGLPLLKPGRKPIEDIVTPQTLEDLEGYASQNVPNHQIAKTLKISLSSFYKLLRENQDWKDAYSRGMESQKYELEKSLFRRATGFAGQEIQTIVDADGKTTTKTTDKMYVPDSTALIFSLKNVYADKYKDRVESVNTVNINVNQIQNLPDEELLKYANAEMLDSTEYQIE